MWPLLFGNQDRRPWGDDPIWWILRQMDASRRLRGRALDTLGKRPQEAPYRIIHQGALMRLRAYETDHAKGPVLLVIPAPIKRPYIWDLVPWASVVRRCVKSGL